MLFCLALVLSSKKSSSDTSLLLPNITSRLLPTCLLSPSLGKPCAMKATPSSTSSPPQASPCTSQKAFIWLCLHFTYFCSSLGKSSLIYVVSWLLSESPPTPFWIFGSWSMPTVYSESLLCAALLHVCLILDLHGWLPESLPGFLLGFPGSPS